MTHRFRAAGENQIGPAACNVRSGGVDCLHARTAVSLHSPRGNTNPASEAQGYNPCDVGFIRAGTGAAEKDLVQLPGTERLPKEQRPSRDYGKIGGPERAGFAS